jgi:hypothetical protein
MLMLASGDQTEQNPTEQNPQEGRVQEMCPAYWFFAGCWLFAMVWLIAHQRLILAGQGLVVTCGVLLFSYLTQMITLDPPPQTAISRRESLFFRIETLLLAGVCVLTGWIGLRFHLAMGRAFYDFASWGWNPEESFLDPDWVGSLNFAVFNPLSYCVIPLIFIVSLTGFRHLGLGRGHRVLRVTILWCAIPLMAVGFFLVTGSSNLTFLARTIVSNTLQNGPFEEFLFRGALQSRLKILFGAPWGLVLASLVFGVWHLGAGFAATGWQSLGDGLASTVVIQATLGLGLGIIYDRTRNLVSPSICHVVFNSL